MKQAKRSWRSGGGTKHRRLPDALHVVLGELSLPVLLLPNLTRAPIRTVHTIAWNCMAHTALLHTLSVRFLFLSGYHELCDPCSRGRREKRLKVRCGVHLSTWTLEIWTIAWTKGVRGGSTCLSAEKSLRQQCGDKHHSIVIDFIWGCVSAWG